MRYLGNVKTSLISENEEYKKLFDPLTESELSDLRESIRASGVINNLIVERSGQEYVLLSGHHRKMVAAELGMDEVPCSMTETNTEKLEALFDNANRRQLTEQKRKEMLVLKAAMADRLYADSLVPEVYDLLKKEKITNGVADLFGNMGKDRQEAVLHTFSSHKTLPKEVKQQFEDEKSALVKTYQEKINDLIRNHEDTIKALHTEINSSRETLGKLTEEKKKAEASLRENNRQVEEMKARVKEKLDEFEEQKGTITVEVRKEFESQITTYTKERETRELVIKSKQDEISRLNDAIGSLKTNIDGLESKSKLWEHECARIAEQYNKTVQSYSNPALVEVQLEVIAQLVESLVRFVKNHKWDGETLKMSERYRTDIDEQMQRLSREIRTNQKEILSPEESRNNVEKALGKGRPQLKSVQGTLAAGV